MRTRQAWAALLSAALLLGLGFFVAACMAWRAEPVSPSSYNRIRSGMTLKEVEDAIGLPAGDYYTRHPRYGLTSGPFASLLQESGVPRHDLPDDLRGETLGGFLVNGEVWCGDTYCIWVVFDEQGKVVGRYLFRTEDSRDSRLTVCLDDLRVWLGL